jgi:hypothetical protein
MAKPMLKFLSWSRERVGELATSVESGRARAETSITLTGRNADGTITTVETRTLAFLLSGPADVLGLKPGAITGRFPAPGTLDAESDKCCHVEFRDPKLPWRYTPAPNPAEGTGGLHPWVALVVGTEGDELTLASGTVTLSVAVQKAHPLDALSDPGPLAWAHVQIDDAGRRVARVLSGRRLELGQAYLVALVPAFHASGAKAWSGTAPVTLRAYDVWRFGTAAPGASFRDLAARIQPGAADPTTTGHAPLDYPRVPAIPDLQIRGALAPIGATDAPEPQEIAEDMAALASSQVDDAGRPVIGLPRYGDAWVADPIATTWGTTLNRDPRHRGVAGIGLGLGIQLQEELAAEAAEHVGDLQEASQRVSDLVLGQSASVSLWRQRVPRNPLRQLWVFGPALRRAVTENGPIADLATAPDRALPAGLFSTAARRVLRTGPVRTAVLDGGSADPADILNSVNTCPAPPERSEDGVVLRDADLADFEERRRRVLATGEIDFGRVADGLAQLDIGQVRPPLRDLATTIHQRLLTAARAKRTAPYARGIELILRGMAVTNAPALQALETAMIEFLQQFDSLGGEIGDLLFVLRQLDEPPSVELPCVPVRLPELCAGVSSAFDPRGAGAFICTRVLSTIDRLDPAQPLAPPEVCIGLDRPVWRDLAAHFSDWLLPGVGALPEDSVIALETNPTFIDALLVGYNTQLLSELRWRNQPLATGCTPLRVFWGRADTVTGDIVRDTDGIAGWGGASSLGDSSHRPDGAASADLVLVFRGRLFDRYPKTLSYLVSALRGGAVDFNEDPATDAVRVLPSFQGRIGPDVTFFGFQGFPSGEVRRHWVLLEEPPAGVRFYNARAKVPPANADGAAFASFTFADPVRVLIRGDRLAPAGVP